jgi:tetratricopeptide (TPR) repeat protein
MPMKTRLSLLLCLAVFAWGQRGGPPLPESAQRAQQLLRAGNYAEAEAAFRAAVADAADSAPVYNAAGTAFDLMGKSKDAQKYFQKAIDLAATPAAKSAAQRAMAMSFAFEGDCQQTARYEDLAAEYWKSTRDAPDRFYQQGELADEAARVCIDAGALDAAEHYYAKGRALGLQQPDIAADRIKLWNFRYEHAMARLAARRGNKAEAEKHVAAARALVDGMEALKAQQQAFVPYLTGYVAFYTGDYKKALEDLQKAAQNDAFIECMIGETYEKLGDKAKALEYYHKAAGVQGHNPPAAYAKRITRQKLG